MSALMLNLLGGFEVRLGDLSFMLPTKRGQALLAFLAMTPDRRHSRDKIAGFLWEDRGEQQARTSLRQTLSVLRKVISPADVDWLRADGDSIALNRDVVKLDVAVFERLAAEPTLPALTQAAALYKGDLLQGLSLRGEAFEDWLRNERERLHERAVQVLGKLLALQCKSADTETGIATAGRLLSLDPLQERAHRAIMQLYVRQGRQDAALRQYELCRERLHRELGVEPEPETEHLYRDIRARRSTPPSGHPARSAPQSADLESAPSKIREGPADRTTVGQAIWPLRDRPSIAVLPFINMSGEPEQQYFSDGITEDIIAELSRYHSLLVMARNSCFQFRGPAVDVAAVRQALGVNYIVDGSVRKAGNRIRVTAQVIDAGSQGQIWTERYDRDIQDIFAVQDEVARAVAATLEGRVAASGAERARRKPTKDWLAYDYFLQGRECVNRSEPPEAERFFAHAIELDPGYAQAYAWKAVALAIKYLLDHRQETLDEATAAANMALALDETDAWAHSAMGMVAFRLRDWDLAGEHYERAIHLNPNDVNIAGDRAQWLLCVGRPDEALHCLDLALQRDPYPPTWFWEVRGHIFYHLKRYDEAIAALRSVRADPFWIHVFLAAAYAQAGQLENARREVARLLEDKPDASLRERNFYANEDMWAHLLDGLRKAGVPE
jgi:TolB-like protein/DNA-binding SARP family transcriptional activator/Flp pilus assembly protein TadD